MKMNRKGFTLIELLAVILILGIIALIAIPTVNKVLQESRVGAWQSTGNQMTKSAENYYQLQVIKDSPFIKNFKNSETSESATGTEKFGTISDGVIGYNGTTAPSASDSELIMKAALEIKGDMPKLADIEIFSVDNSGTATLKFKTPNAYCLSTDKTFSTVAEYTAAVEGTIGTAGNILKAGGNVKCIAKQ